MVAIGRCSMNGSFAQFCRSTGLRRSLLIVAPHPDDETIGCGGLIALAAAAGIRTSVVVVTDGSASHSGSHLWPPHRVAHRRQIETAKALKILGVDEPALFLELPDARTDFLAPDVELRAVRRLEDQLDKCRPDVVLTTWRREPHCDHRFSYVIARDAVRSAVRPVMLVEYMVWTYLIGEADDAPRPDETASFYLDIEFVRTSKRNAVAAHRTQLGRIIRDDPNGFRLTPNHLRFMTLQDEQYELPRT